MIGLSDHEHALIVEVFKRYPEIEQAGLFGSRALGTHRPNSDIDLAIWGKTLDEAKLASLISALDELPLPYLFDVKLYHFLDDAPFIEHIDQYTQKIYPL